MHTTPTHPVTGLITMENLNERKKISKRKKSKTKKSKTKRPRTNRSVVSDCAWEGWGGHPPDPVLNTVQSIFRP